MEGSEHPAMVEIPQTMFEIDPKMPIAKQAETSKWVEGWLYSSSAKCATNFSGVPFCIKIDESAFSG